jgi:hypothetical protein
MDEYKKLVQSLRACANPDKNGGCDNCKNDGVTKCLEANMNDAADAIEELLAFAKFVAREAIDTGDNDGVSAEILCRKLNKLGLIETDGEFWMLPLPPKGVE